MSAPLANGCRALLVCLAGALSLAGHALRAQPRVGMVESPCPAPVLPTAALRHLLVELFVEPRALTSDDFDRLARHPDLAVLNTANRERAAVDWAALCRYRADNEVAMKAVPPPRVVLMGDSITENWVLADPALFSQGVVGRGISGQTSPQMLVRFRADVVALRPRVVHILAGTNDVAGNTGPTSAEDFEGNIQSMVEIAKANGIDVVLGSIPPAAAFTWRPEVRPVPIIAALNEWLRDYAAREGIELIDYHVALAGPNGELKADLGNDGVHPNRKGYAIMRALLEPKLASALH
jgi:lysophospholipase L1-like esterase